MKGRSLLKKAITILGTVFVLAMCSSPPVAGAALKTSSSASPVAEPVKTINAEWLERRAAEQEKQERIHLQEMEREKATQQMTQMISLLEAQVGKTWYVFSGSTPSGWDCSGMVMWAYEQMGIPLEHRATKQKYAGKIVTDPKVGDIVAFSHPGSEYAFHVGIWLGPDLMIHAGGRKGDRTEIIPISSFESGSIVTFTRIIDTN